MRFFHLKTAPRGRLLAPQPRDPKIAVFQRFQQRLDLAEAAAGAGIAPMQHAGPRFVFLPGEAGAQIHQAQAPLARHLVPVSQSLRKMIARFQKKHG